MIPSSADQAVAMGLAALDDGRSSEVLPVLIDAVRRWPDHAVLWQVRGLLHRSQGDLARAVASFRRAARLAPASARIALGRATCVLEAGYPASDLFLAAIALAPLDAWARRGLAAALLAERRIDAAIEVVERFLSDRPEWIDGFWLSARLRLMDGDATGHLQAIDAALRRAPRSADLWRQRVTISMRKDDYDGALRAIAQARCAIGDDPWLDLARAASLSETWDLTAADGAFRRRKWPRDVAATVHETRHLIRCNRPQAAADLIAPVARAQGFSQLVPYLGLALRMLGDNRWHDMEGDQRLVGVYDLADRLPLAELAQLAKRLHFAKAQPPEQSIRNGIQTDGHILHRAEPVVRLTREVLSAATADYLSRLPGTHTGSGVRGKGKGSIRFSGSWSVWLRNGGFHDGHAHPEGVASSALYLELPESVPGEKPNAGWLALGLPPANLGTSLAPFREIEPRPGRLVLFPSTMLHGTHPFGAGSRLSIAFDIAR